MTRKKGKASRRVFVSHASRDGAFTDKLTSMLRRHNVDVWYSKAHIVSAQEWHDEIGKALVRCNWFLVVLSKNSIRSTWVRRELNYALRNERYEERIIPVLYRPCKVEELSWTLPGFQFADFTKGFDVGCRRLLRIWGIEYKKDPADS